MNSEFIPKLDWKDDDPVTENDFIRYETGISDAHRKLKEHDEQFAGISTNVQEKIDTAIAALINGAPGALDTLKELATAMGDDPNFATTVLNRLTAAEQTTVAHQAETTHVPHIGTTTNVGNAYSITTSITIAANQKFTIKFNAASTGAATLNISSIGSAKGIKKPGGTDATLKVGVYSLFYDGINFQLLGEGGEYGTAEATQVLSGYTVGRESGIVEGIIPKPVGWQPTNMIEGTAVVGRLYLGAPKGYYNEQDAPNGSLGVFCDDPDFIAANIKQGANIFGLNGTMPPSDGAGIGARFTILRARSDNAGNSAQSVTHDLVTAKRVYSLKIYIEAGLAPLGTSNANATATLTFYWEDGTSTSWNLRDKYRELGTLETFNSDLILNMHLPEKTKLKKIVLYNSVYNPYGAGQFFGFGMCVVHV
jgi:hypothetical protein